MTRKGSMLWILFVCKHINYLFRHQFAVASLEVQPYISTLFDEFPLILNILKRGNKRWENLAVRVYRFQNLAASKAQ